MSSHAIASSNLSTSSTVSVSVPSGEYVRITSPSGTNISVRSIAGGSYQVSDSPQAGTNIFEFVPGNTSNYQIVLALNSSNFQSSFASITKEGSISDQPVKNITGFSSLQLTLDVNSTSSMVASAAWNPLFGLTGLRIQSVSISFTNVLEGMAALGLLIVALGLIFHSRISYLGIVLLFIAGAIVLGFLNLFLIAMGYAASFGFLTLAWKVKHRRAG